MTGAGQRPTVVEENAKAGSLDWLPRRLRFTPGSRRGEELGTDVVNWLDSGRSPSVEGYCSDLSVAAGDTLTVYVNTRPATPFRLDVYRLGFYGGLGARLVTSHGPHPGVAQPEPIAADGRLMECRWTPSVELHIGDDWLSGVYLGKITRLDDGVEHYVIFVVRDDRDADLVVQCSDFTWQAYNRWPSDFSLYSNGTDNKIAYYGTDVAASFDRPYVSTTHFAPAVPGTGEYFVFEFPFTYWLESMGYDVTYCSNLDTHLGRARPARARGFLSVGHDEYWTRGIYDNVMAAVQNGVNLGFFCGNSVCFELDLRAGTDGRPDRVISRKDVFRQRGVDGDHEGPGGDFADDVAAFREMFPFPLEAPDDGALMGARNEWPIQGCGDWVCTLPDHWVFEGTDMGQDEAIPNLVGHEWHGGPANLPGLEVVSRGPTTDYVGDGEYTATVHPGPKENFVFNAATCWWATGLALPPGFQRPTWSGMPSALPDARVQRITANVLDRMIR